MLNVEFIKACELSGVEYSPGDSASFTRFVANGLVATGRAKIAPEKEKKKPVKKKE